jgi:hypothetical protein
MLLKPLKTIGTQEGPGKMYYSTHCVNKDSHPAKSITCRRNKAENLFILKENNYVQTIFWGKQYTIGISSVLYDFLIRKNYQPRTTS